MHFLAQFHRFWPEFSFLFSKLVVFFHNKFKNKVGNRNEAWKFEAYLRVDSRRLLRRTIQSWRNDSEWSQNAETTCVIDPYQRRCLEVALFLKTSAKETFARVVKNINEVVDMIINVEPSVVSTRIFIYWNLNFWLTKNRARRAKG